MGRIGLINSGGASSGATDLAEAVRTAVINKRAGGMGLISGRKAFQRPMAEGVELLNAIQDVYLDPLDHHRLTSWTRGSSTSTASCGGVTSDPRRVDAVAALRAAGHAVWCCTNNSAATVADYEAKLASHGIEHDGLITSSMAMATLVSPGERILACAEAGAREALDGAGAVVVDGGLVADGARRRVRRRRGRRRVPPATSTTPR